jgi:hypothetical protein
MRKEAGKGTVAFRNLETPLWKVVLLPLGRDDWTLESDGYVLLQHSMHLVTPCPDVIVDQGQHLRPPAQRQRY